MKNMYINKKYEYINNIDNQIIQLNTQVHPKINNHNF